MCFVLSNQRIRQVGFRAGWADVILDAYSCVTLLSLHVSHPNLINLQKTVSKDLLEMGTFLSITLEMCATMGIYREN